MKRYGLSLVALILIIFLVSCDFASQGNQSQEGTAVALAIQQTSLALDQTRVAQAGQPAQPENPVIQQVQPTYTLYPTYTVQVQTEPPVIVQPTQEPVIVQLTQGPVIEEPAESFEDWLENVNILLYDDMLSMWETQVIENAINGLGLGRNTTNVGDAMGNFLSEMNSALVWDLIIVGAESRDSISGDYFDVLGDQIDRGSSVIIEIWYIDDISSGRIQPLMQRCGISFQRDWWRNPQDNLNDFLVYLLEPGDPMFSQPNSISLLAPYDIMWIDDIGDYVEVTSGSSTAILLGGGYPQRYNDFGLLVKCMDSRMVWQLFSTHDYKTQEMINLWQNYIYNTLQARYEYLNN